MQQLGTSLARGHLRLASATAAPGPGRRLALQLRAFWATLVALWNTMLAGVASLLALLPLLLRSAPVGRKAPQRRPPREARIIPFQPRRRAGAR